MKAVYLILVLALAAFGLWKYFENKKYLENAIPSQVPGSMGPGEGRQMQSV